MSRIWIGLLGAVAGASAVALGLGLGSLSETPPAPSAVPSAVPRPDPDEPDARGGEVVRLTAELAQERARREQLEGELEVMYQTLAALEVEEAAPERAPPAPQRTPEERARRRRANADLEVDTAQLQAAGFHRSDVEAFAARLNEIQMERLYLHDRATREGWRVGRRFAEEVAPLIQAERALRSEFGEELYDWVLFTSGRTNRVEVTHVFPASAADEAGIRVGDRVARYDDSAIFSPQDLRELTVAGRAGTLTALDIERDGTLQRLYVPRGPLGVRVGATSQEPPAPR